MAITFPRADVFTSIEFAEQKWRLVSRQELSRQANGVTRGKDFGSALWFAEWRTVNLKNMDSVEAEAILNSLDGTVNGFYAHDLRRPYPASDPDGSFTDSGEIHSVGLDLKSLKLKSLPNGFVLTRGDYLAFDYGAGPSRALHQVMEATTADGGGTTAFFEVRPHIRPGAEADIAVTLKKPSALMRLDPGSLDQVAGGTWFGNVTFRAFQSL
jgi:hypothetical protein